MLMPRWLNHSLLFPARSVSAFLFSAVLAVSLWWSAGTALAADTNDLRLVPWPRSVGIKHPTLRLTATNRIVAGEDSVAPLARILSEEIRLTTGLQLATATGVAVAGDVLLQTDRNLKDEAYQLEVADHVSVRGANYQAVASATATLLQLLAADQGSATVPGVVISDQPAHPYRGLLIDLGRKYHTPGGLEQVIELCRLYKIRYLHVHISDDQLFMFPSTKFPQAGKGNWEFARFEPGSKPKIQPYTREELIALERFSQERGVHIVPEMDMPGHCGRLVGDARETFGFPGNGSTINIASPKALEGAATLLNEMMDIFQGTPYVHLGGDEVGLGGLEGTPEFKELQARLGNIKNSHDLYCKFIADMHDVIARRGKKMIVWEEACNPGGAYPLPKDTLIMIWCLGRNPDAVTRQGYSVVNATWTPLYIVRDNRKSLEFLFDWEVPKFGREGSTNYVTMKDTTGLLGTQLCSWENPENIEIQCLRDRLALVAERAWNPQAGGSFADFKTRWAGPDAVLEKLIHPITVRVQGRFVGGDNRFEEPITVTLEPKRPGFTLKYTLDNSLPNKSWQTYTGPLLLEKTAHLRAGLFDAQDAQQGYLVGSWFRGVVPAKPNLATKKPVTVGPAPDRTDGWFARLAVDGRTDDVWAHWASAGPAPQWLQIDLQQVYPVDSIKVITFYDGSRYYQLTAEVSVDGKQWTKVLDLSDNKKPATSAGYGGSFPKTDARYVRINMLKNSANPFVHIVEVMVNQAK
jgi:hexosaminidase